MYDVIIVGSGPIGLYAAVLSSLHALNSAVFEARDKIGGQLSNLYPQKPIVDLPGQVSLTAQGFIDLLQAQIQARTENKPEIHLNESILSFEKKTEGYEVRTTVGTYMTKTILIASGMGNFSPRKMDLPGEDQFKNIIYAIPDKEVARGKRVVMLGGGDSAVDMCLLIEPLCQDIHIVHRRPEFRAQADSVEALKKTKCVFHTPYSPSELKGEGDRLTSIVIKNNDDGTTQEIPVDLLVVNFGMVPGPNNFPLEKVGTNIVVHDAYQTSCENVFAVGNTINYPGKVKNITCGLGEAVVAITKIDQIVHPGKNIPVHF